MTNKKLNLESKVRFKRLVTGLENMIVRQSIPSSNYIKKQDSEAIYFNGEEVYREGYENVGWPGTANVRRYYAFSDGILKIGIFMGEESADVEYTELYSPQGFAMHLKENATELQLHNYLCDKLKIAVLKGKVPGGKK